MSPTALTIGQLAAHVGVTVRAVRHYHSRGLLPEPARDASGYRRYDARAVVGLIRIRTLAEAGVPLARIGQLLDAEPADFSAAIAAVDQRLKARIRALQEHRRRLDQLARGERLFVGEDVVEILDALRAMGVTEGTVQLERDGWILLAALAPEPIGEWVRQKRAALDDPEFRRLYLACDRARDWDPTDPRLDELATTMAEWTAPGREPELEAFEESALGPAVALLSAHVTAVSPAWHRLNDLAQDPRRRS